MLILGSLWKNTVLLYVFFKHSSDTKMTTSGRSSSIFLLCEQAKIYLKNKIIEPYFSQVYYADKLSFYYSAGGFPLRLRSLKKTSCYRYINNTSGCHSRRFCIDWILISSRADFLALISSSRKVFFPSLHSTFRLFVAWPKFSASTDLNFQCYLGYSPFLRWQSLHVGRQL